MNIEAVLICPRADKINNSSANSGILFDGNFAITTGTILMPFLKGPVEKNWNPSSISIEGDRIFSRIRFKVCRELRNEGGEGKRLIFSESKIVSVWKCPLVTRSLENLFRDWTVKNGRSPSDGSIAGGGEDEAKEFISILVLVKCEGKEDERWEANMAGDGISRLAAVYRKLVVPTRGEEIEIVSTPFGNELFMNSSSRGIVSNLVGMENCLILTDARTVPGCEGGPIFAAKKSRIHKEDKNKLLGMVTCPLTWWRGEWVGLTIGINFKPVLKRFFQGKIDFVEPPLASRTEACLEVPEIVDEAVVLVQCENAWGSGVVLDPRTVITCSHVLKEGEKICVFFKKNYYPASVTYKTHDGVPYDLAVIKVKNEVFKKRFEFCEKPPEIGDEVIAVGFPFFSEKDDSNLRATLVCGSIAGANPYMIQTTCCIQSGFSGGPLLKKGKLLGIIIYNVVNSTAGAIYPHVNFAVPTSVFQDLISNYLRTNDVKYLEHLECSDPKVQSLWSLKSSKL